jgi:hypothetical protein
LKRKRARIVARPLTLKETKTLRLIISGAPWKDTKPDGEYRDCPHAWVDRRGLGKQKWDRFARLIRACGELRSWKAPWGETYRYRYLLLDRKAYWAIWPVINRADASSVAPAPPPEPLRRAVRAGS